MMRKFMRTRDPRPATHGPLTTLATADTPHKSNGIANGGNGAARRDDPHSTLSRYWSCSSDECEAGGAGGAGRARGSVPWEDPEFPPSGKQLPEKRHVVWLRPHDLCPRPRFLGDTALETDLDTDRLEPEPPEQFAARWQIKLGVWGCGAVCEGAAALALTPRLLARVVPPQSFRHRYTGKFRFWFWVFGSWREVWVDDRLPTRAGRLLATTCTLHDDFTLPLLEKAYAKLHGSYVSVRECSVSRALQELTGGVVQSFSPPQQPPALLLQVLSSALPRSTIIVATPNAEKEGFGRRMRNGLIGGQAYCVTGLARVQLTAAGAGETLVRVRAVSGRGEWAGRGARGGVDWRALGDADRDLLERRAALPGHFWMPFDELRRAFGRVELVHVGPDDWLAEPALRERRAWRAVVARRRWRVGHNAGGAPPARTAHANPQFRVRVPAASGKCHVVVSVTQHYAVPTARAPLHSIGFAVYELPPTALQRRPALLNDFFDLRALDVTHWSRAREVATFFTLPPGEYLVVPHTRRPHTAAAFLLRILTDELTDIWEVNDDNAIIRDIAAEFEREDWPMPSETRSIVNKLHKKPETEEVEADSLAGAVRRAGGVRRRGACLELSRALLALRDPGVTGRVPARRVPPLLALLAYWRQALDAAGRPRCAPRASLSAYRLRALLWACGVSASNKVLECLVVRFARGPVISPQSCLLALARLHLAHERYRTLEAKLKSNPLSLEEMILMTIYS